IFEAFAQVGDPGQGLGIGLTLVRQLVELHGGSIQAESEGLGRGSAFRVRLPLAQQPKASPVEPTASREVTRAGIRILIVDDNESAALMLRILLQERGYATQSAFTG